MPKYEPAALPDGTPANGGLTLQRLVAQFQTAGVRTPRGELQDCCFFLPFPTAEDDERLPGTLYLHELTRNRDENKIYWWAALVAWNIAALMYNGQVKAPDDMRLLQLPAVLADGVKQPLRLRGVDKADPRLLDTHRNDTTHGLGRKVTRYWTLENKENLREIYKALYRSVCNMPGQRLEDEIGHLRLTLYCSAGAAALAQRPGGFRGGPAGALADVSPAEVEDWERRLLDGGSEGSLWANITREILPLLARRAAWWAAPEQPQTTPEDKAQLEALRALLEGDPPGGGYMLEILAAAVLLALNAGALLDGGAKAPLHRYETYERQVLLALAQQTRGEPAGLAPPEQAESAAGRLAGREPDAPPTTEELYHRERAQERQMADQAEIRQIVSLLNLISQKIAAYEAAFAQARDLQSMEASLQMIYAEQERLSSVVERLPEEMQLTLQDGLGSLLQGKGYTHQLEH